MEDFIVFILSSAYIFYILAPVIIGYIIFKAIFGGFRAPQKAGSFEADVVEKDKSGLWKLKDKDGNFYLLRYEDFQLDNSKNGGIIKKGTRVVVERITVTGSPNEEFRAREIPKDGWIKLILGVWVIAAIIYHFNSGDSKHHVSNDDSNDSGRPVFVNRLVFDYGTLSIDDKQQLLFNDKPFSAIQDSYSFSFKKRFQFPNDTDIVLIQGDTGGTACPALFYFVSVSAQGATATPSFGTCSDLIEIKKHKSEIDVTMPDAEKRMVTFIYEAGVVREQNGLQQR